MLAAHACAFSAEDGLELLIRVLCATVDSTRYAGQLRRCAVGDQTKVSQLGQQRCQRCIPATRAGLQTPAGSGLARACIRRASAVDLGHPLPRTT